MISPLFLNRGSKVAVVAPAKTVPAQQVREALTIIESWGLQVYLGEHLFDQHHVFAGSDENRLADLQQALDDPEIRAIFCARGGYGTVRIIDQIDWQGFQKSPKWIIGFSDITYLHGKLNQLGYQSIHGIMPALFPDPKAEEALSRLKDVLFGHRADYQWASNSFNRNGSLEGQLVGGNLSILQQMVSCEGDFDTHGKILFIEEIGEYLYHFERMLWHLKRVGKLSEIKGLLLGHLTDLKDNPISFGVSAEEIVLNLTKEYNYPVAFGLPFGHEPNNMPLVIGANIKAWIRSEGVRLEYESGQKPT